jgi:hypothetical protein
MTSGALPRKSMLFLSVLFAVVTGGRAYSQGLEFADGLKYNDFYAVTVYHSGGESFTLFDAASFEGENPPWPDNKGDFGKGPGSDPGEEMKYFFWIRRIGTTGAITYPLSFRKILEIDFSGPYGGTVARPAVQGQLTIGDESSDVSVLIGGESREGNEIPGSGRFSGWFGKKEPAVPSFTPAKITLSDGSEQDVLVKTDGFLGGIDEEFGTYAMLWLQHDDVEKLVFNHNGSYARCPECGAIFYDNRYEQCPFDGADLVSPRERP